MDTKPLERFATQARRDLLSYVDARATAVLAAGSVARAERPEVVRKLEAEITAHGREHVIDKVAYTWFNRIIALRFMDARRYTAAGIVSPAQGQTHGQPEILTEAKRGNLDADVVNNKTTAETILGLLDGTRRSTDAEGEAYALLLTEYCRHWHKSMPFMFEREGDYTELLVPTGLLADGAILSTARQALSEEVCDDVEVIGWLYQFYISERKKEVFRGFGAKGIARRLAGPNEIPAATQLFTPDWIVRYLVENSLGRLWMLNRPDSRLADQMPYYIPDDQTDFLKVSTPEELTVIDPACGSGHMLTYAFDLLYAIYEEEGYAPADIASLILTHNLHGTEIDPRAASLAAFALSMKARATQRSFFTLQVLPRVCVIAPLSITDEEVQFLAEDSGLSVELSLWSLFANADALGSLLSPDLGQVEDLNRWLMAREDDGSDLISSELNERARQLGAQAAYLARTYAVALANPPYMGASNMGPTLAEFVRRSFPASRADLFAAFIERCIALVQAGGRVGMITMHTWMFIASFEKLRARVLTSTSIRHLAHLGTGAFDSIGGEVVSTVAFVLSVGNDFAGEGNYLRLIGDKGESGKSAAARLAAQNPESNVYRRPQTIFASIPGAPIAYWLSDSFYRAFAEHEALGDIAIPRTGMRTGDNARFLRLWHEVSRSAFSKPGKTEAPSAKWVVYAKGGPSRRWFGNVDTVVNWADDGHEIKEETLRNYPQLSWDNLGWKISNESYFFQPGVTWTDMSTTSFGARVLPAGCIFDAAGPSLFSGDALPLLGLLNSSTAFAVLTLLNPTLHFKNYNIAAIPLPAWTEVRADLEVLARSAVELVQADWSEAETSWAYETDPLVRVSALAPSSIATIVENLRAVHLTRVSNLRAIETAVNRRVVDAYGIDSIEVEVDPADLTLTFNPMSADEVVTTRDYVMNLISFAVGCMFGRYSLDKPGLILAEQASKLDDYLASIPSPSVRPDIDNVIPFVDDGWFEDDIVERFRHFLRVAFGAEHFEMNLRFVEESLGVKNLRDYFITKGGKSKFYDDHLQRYKKRPVYWMFSSRTGAFNALIYMHRYNPSTVSTVLNEYLREYRTKLDVALANAEQAGAAGSNQDQKEADRLRKVIAELNDYEHDVLYPLATQQIAIDLDDGVKANYPKFYPALRKIAGLEAAE